jgi:non-specific serine/threonine protein kinase
VQTLAFLQRLKEESIRTEGPEESGDRRTSLLVVPVNTIANWESEIRRFTPDLRYLLHYGPARNREALHTDGYDFILSSYHTVRSDIGIFKKMNFNCIILDESQCIKNSNSQLFKAVRTLKSDHRLSLTGTPIENSTFELWSQMEFLNPGILGSRTEFSRRFAKPIEKYNDKSATGKLRKITYPFILRRSKEDVLRELPDKLEITLYSQMGSHQSSIYEQHRNFFQKAILHKIEEDGLERSTIEIFSALLKLRQIALFPVLADAKFASVESCKFEQMKEVVEEVLREDHKIAIFSQFVGCLDIFKEHMHKKRLSYSYIDGSVTASKRKVQIQQFQEKDDCRLFLASLKAGGVGINLTAADYVILFDPWWNPAVESQAVDRLHRIGQEKKVFAYKLVVKDTVEEKMLELQQRKKKLVRDLVTEESGFFKSLTEREIASFFEAR